MYNNKGRRNKPQYDQDGELEEKNKKKSPMPT